MEQRRRWSLPIGRVRPVHLGDNPRRGDLAGEQEMAKGGPGEGGQILVLDIPSRAAPLPSCPAACSRSRLNIGYLPRSRRACRPFR
jgi:hypothetical protein